MVYGLLLEVLAATYCCPVIRRWPPWKKRKAGGLQPIHRSPITTIKASILFLQNRITFRSYCNGPVLYLPQFSPYNDVSPCMSAGYYINVQWPYHMVMRSQSSENSDFTHLKGNDFILPSSSVAIHRDGDIPLVYWWLWRASNWLPQMV